MEKANLKTIFQVVGVWLFLRLLTSLTATAFSLLNPVTPIEKRIPLWPPAQDCLTWLNRVFVAPWSRYDAVWFSQILTHGYAAGDGSTSFHPMYLWFSYPLYRLGVDAPLSLLITSTLAALVFIGIFYRLARLDEDPTIAWIALLLMITFPVAFILFAPYTESLFLLWTAAALYSIRRNRWGLAALFSFIAALTRQQGVFLVLPLAWEIWEASGKSLDGIRRVWYSWLTLLAAPAGLAAWGVYRIAYLHEGNLNLLNIQGLIYSAFLSPSADKIIAGQAFHWPWDALMVAVSTAIHAPELNVVVNLILGIGFLIAFIVAWRYLKTTDRLFSVAIILISFSVTTGQYAYVSLPRHLFLAFPVFYGVAAGLHKFRYKQFLIVCQTLGLIFLIYGYVLNGWIP